MCTGPAFPTVYTTRLPRRAAVIEGYTLTSTTTGTWKAAYGGRAGSDDEGAKR
jgi:hypothetical protein